MSFAQTVEVWDVASNTALERAAARAESELAQAAARQEVAAAVGVDANEGSARPRLLWAQRRRSAPGAAGTPDRRRSAAR